MRTTRGPTLCTLPPGWAKMERYTHARRCRDLLVYATRTYTSMCYDARAYIFLYLQICMLYIRMDPTTSPCCILASARDGRSVHRGLRPGRIVTDDRSDIDNFY